MLLTKIPHAETREEAERQKVAFEAWATRKGVPAAGRRLAEDWERLVTFPAEYSSILGDGGAAFNQAANTGLGIAGPTP